MPDPAEYETPLRMAALQQQAAVEVNVLRPGHGTPWEDRGAIGMVPAFVKTHIAGMGSSYVLMLIAFYVDNGKQLPLWRDLPHFTYWLLPLAAGLPFIVFAMLRHPLAQRS